MNLLRPRHLALILAGLSAPAFAQLSAKDGAVQQVEVKGTSAAYDPRRDDTASRIVVGREEIARYGDTSVLDVFKRIPGVTVTTGSGRSTQVRMRGLGAGYTQVLVNGERTPAGFSLDNLSPDTIERIEVLRVASAEFPAAAVAGTINIVLRKTIRKREREAKLGYLLSSDFRGPTFSTQLAERGEASSWSLSASGNHDTLAREWSGHEENTRPDGVVDLRRTTFAPERGHMNRLNLGPTLNWTLDNGDKLAWETTFNSSSFRNNPQPRVTTLAGNPPPTPDLQIFGEFDDRMLKSDLRWARELPAGAKLDAKLGFEWSSRKMFVRRVGFDGAGLPESDGSTLLDTHARGANSTGKATRALDGGHALSLGWDIGVNASSDIRVERDRIRLLAPGLPLGTPLDEQFRATATRAAFYAQDEWTVTPLWSVYLGTRWEGSRTRVSGSGFEAARVDSSILSPILQTLYKFAGADGKKSGDQLRLALSRTYKPPGLYSLVPRRSAWENNSATEADFVGNPKLKPEQAWGIDAAYEHYWAEGAMVSVSGTVKRIDDYMSNHIYFDGLRWIFTPVNDDRAMLRTLEVETRFPLKSLFAGAPAIDLRASVSRNWSRVESVPGPNNRMEQQAPLTANAGFDYKSGALAAGASVAHRRGGAIRVDVNRGFYNYARTDLDAYALWTFNPKLQWRVALSNLLGEDGGFEVSYLDPVRGLEKRGWNYPGGVKLRTTLEMKF
ncbi:TonB-dependent receptor plug domain-containing protein [Telluria aromaticivorans]|uniref:TonB-dependent receptor n=1 Tax=Telluria aromaticivorans TaxID=2725995 RepID=A0A7Y2JYC3_9BURK|nr:TonB-dependent receptor [Telluria aromaticivorans]NNG23252.1 TonB-dependent receptor [Telluria aromaticivorans]